MRKSFYIYGCFFVIGLLCNCLRASESQIRSPQLGADYENFKRQAIGKLEGRAKRILSSGERNKNLQGFKDRIQIVEEVTAMMISHFQAIRMETMNDLLQVAGGPEPLSVTTRTSAVTIDAADIYSEYKNIFSVPMASPSLTDAQLETLRTYYRKLVQVASMYIADRGKGIVAIDEKRDTEILELCCIMTFLHIPDETWKTAHIDALADWMKTKNSLSVLEAFALRVRRPCTAYQLKIYTQDQEGKKDVEGYLDYLLNTAMSLIKKRDYHAGIFCLKSGIDKAEAEKNAVLSVDLRFQLAETLNKVGHPDLAAEEYLKLMKQYPECSDWGKAAINRLKSLYETANYEIIIHEASNYRTDKRCQSCLPQILYVTWISYRRLNLSEQAAQIEADFLKTNSDHPLAADMYFASAMEAMASGNYEEADRILEIIEYRHSKSRVLQKARKIRERLTNIHAGIKK